MVYGHRMGGTATKAIVRVRLPTTKIAQHHLGRAGIALVVEFAPELGAAVAAGLPALTQVGVIRLKAGWTGTASGSLREPVGTGVLQDGATGNLESPSNLTQTHPTCLQCFDTLVSLNAPFPSCGAFSLDCGAVLLTIQVLVACNSIVNGLEGYRMAQPGIVLR
jgi:hypothetical protein